MPFNITSLLRLCKHRIIQLLLLCTLLFSELGFAAKPPPGVPKRKDCNRSLSAIKLQDLDFGYILAGTSGNVTMATDGSRTSTGSIVFLGGSPSAAQYEVNSTLAGCDYYVLKIKKPRNSTLAEPLGDSMVAKRFKTSPLTKFTLIPNIPQIIDVGARLTVVAGQSSGKYDSAPNYTFKFTFANP